MSSSASLCSSTHITYNTSFNLYNNCLRQVLLSQLHRWKNWAPSTLSYFVIERLSEKCRFEPRHSNSGPIHLISSPPPATLSALPLTSELVEWTFIFRGEQSWKKKKKDENWDRFLFHRVDFQNCQHSTNLNKAMPFSRKRRKFEKGNNTNQQTLEFLKLFDMYHLILSIHKIWLHFTDGGSETSITSTRILGFLFYFFWDFFPLRSDLIYMSKLRVW